MVFDSLKRALGGAGGDRAAELQVELDRVQKALFQRADELDKKRATRLQALFPEGPVAGAGEGHYPDLAPVNFEESEPMGWLVSAATGIIDNFPGSESLLSQLDETFSAFADANFYRVVEGGPYDELLTWRKETFACWDLDADVPIYVGNGSGTKVRGCKTPLIVLDRAVLDAIDVDEQRFLLAACLGHVFFGNLRIFAFYRLMEIIDKLPSMTSIVTRGLGMIPGIGNTITKGVELARTLNNQIIRKSNLVIGQRQRVLCDRLACLAVGGQEPAQRYFARVALGGEKFTDPAVRAALIKQGGEVLARFDRGEVDVNMLSVVGPDDPFAALRAHKLDEWSRGERSTKISEGYYVTRQRLEEHLKADAEIEREISKLENRLIELHKQQGKLQEELQRELSRRSGDTD